MNIKHSVKLILTLLAATSPVQANLITIDKIIQTPDGCSVVLEDTTDGNIAKDGEGSLILQTGEYQFSCLFVREGDVYINNDTIKAYSPAKAGKLTVAGKDASMKIDGGKFLFGTSAMIGGLDGSGNLHITNGAVVANVEGHYITVGSGSYEHDEAPKIGSGNLHASSNDGVNRYQGGIYTNSSDGKYRYGRGVVTIDKRSLLFGGWSGIHLAEGELNVLDESNIVVGYELTDKDYDTLTSLDDFIASPCSGGNGSQVNIGAQIGSTSVVNVKGGSVFDNGTSLNIGYSTDDPGDMRWQDKTTVTINIDGKDSKFLSCHAASQIGSNSQLHSDTTINLTNGGNMTLSEVFTGNDNGSGKVTINIDSRSSFVAQKIEMKKDVIINNAGLLETADKINVGNGATINMQTGGCINSDIVMQAGSKMAFTLSSVNTQQFVQVITGDVTQEGKYTLSFKTNENLKAGRYMLIDASNATDITALKDSSSFTVEGLGVSAENLTWEDDSKFYLTLGNNLLVTHDPLADAVQAANWGVYKSSQAFTSQLWAPRPNAVVVKSVETPTADGKGTIMTTEAEGRTLAWGSVYSSFARNSRSGDFGGAEYSIYGGAVGLERQFAGGSSIGAAFGYDWGKVSPFTTSRVEQESWHAALYGRAAEWKLGKKSSVAIDWSAAVGSTTSEHKALGSDWTQENLQLDARATYGYALTERTALSAFVGAQYYAQNDDSTERVDADSMQNLRLMMGAGISHQLTEKTTLFGEAMLFNDTMRHNPYVTLDGFEYGTGANPGRLGGSVTAGAQYQLTPEWTLRGSYSYEGAEDNNEHRVNVGAVYAF